MLRLVLLLLATFWAWETLRYSAEQFVGTAFRASRPLHPFVVAALPLYVLWPDWVSALAVAGATGLLVAFVDHHFSASEPPPTYVPPRRRTGGLPPLPR